MNRQTESLDTLVIGGGVSGLACAWHLRRNGLQVELWEGQQEAGGKIRSRQGQGWLTESGATWLMDPAGDTTPILEGVGLGTLLTRKKPDAARYLLRDGVLQDVPSTVAGMLRSKLFSFAGRMRLATEPFRPRLAIPGESVSDFVLRRFGREVLQYGIEPYVAGSLASDVEQAEAKATLPRLTGLEERFGSITAGVLCRRLQGAPRPGAPQAASFSGGMQSLIDSLSVSVRPLLGKAAKSISRVGSRWWVEAVDGSVTSARHLVVATPAQETAALVRDLNQTLAHLLDGITYAPVMVVHLGFSRDAVTHRLEGTGFLVPGHENRQINGCLWPASVFSNRAPQGHVLLSCYLGGARHPGALLDDDKTAVNKVLSDLEPLLGLRADPVMVRIDRHPRALPLYFGAYSQRLKSIDQQFEKSSGLHLVSAYAGGVSVRDRLIQAGAVAEKISTQLLGSQAVRRLSVNATKGLPQTPLASGQTLTQPL